MPKAVSHITISSTDRAKIYLTAQMLIRRSRERAAAARRPVSMSMRADILEQVVCQSHSSIDEVARQVGCKPGDQLFIEEWQEVAQLVADLTKLHREITNSM
jgi:hypothetical protein